MAAASPAKRAPKKGRPAPAEPVDAHVPSDDELNAELAKLTDETVDELVDEDGNIRPVEIGKKGRTPNPVIHVFTLDGVKYGMPGRPNPAIMLKFQREWRKASRLPQNGTRAGMKINPRAEAQNAATMDLLLDMLGEEAIDALATSPEVGEEEMAAVFARVTKIGFGGLAQAVEATQGN